MSRLRLVLLALSGAVVLAMLGGGIAFRAKAADGSRQVVLFTDVLQLVEENYVDDVETSRLMRGAYEGLLAGLDSQGSYLTPDEVAWWKQAPLEASADPGITVLKTGNTLHIVSVAADSPAAAAGISIGDQVRRIDDRPVRDLSIEESRRLLSGAAGTSLRLAILHVRENFKREEIRLTRAPRKDAPYTLEVRDGIALLTLRDFARVDREALAKEIELVAGRGIDKLLVDLRGAASGNPREAAGTASLFATGTLFTLKDRSGKSIETVSAGTRPPAWSGAVAVLVNTATAGAAEGLAELLRTNRRATVFGEATYGLGAEARLIELPDGAGLLVPSAVWEVAGGKRWNGDGIAPDRVIRAEGAADLAEKEQLRRALEEFSKAVAEAKPKAA